MMIASHVFVPAVLLWLSYGETEILHLRLEANEWK